MRSICSPSSQPAYPGLQDARSAEVASAYEKLNLFREVGERAGPTEYWSNPRASFAVLGRSAPATHD